ncbi:BTAD domain-containing putative transcriptional regulator [Streptomyces sp. NPDC013978]|uniref:AfsR/SARP family transcriptional regulator n=1 Tax=Streptomyces sp. NPDC013978 TaxID=3364869 RepID=UPI0036FB2621
MDIGILGPLIITKGRTFGQVDLAPKPRIVLAVLAGNPGGLLPVSVLMREVWGEAPPRSSLRNLHTYVLQIRKQLAQACALPRRTVAEELLVTRPGGYAISDTLVSYDHRVYAQLSERGRNAIHNGELLQGISLLSRALAVWRGPAYADVVTGPVLDAQRRQMQDSRIGDIEAISEARISAGQYHEAISELTIPVAENPLHEGLHFQYMRALGISGSRARALEVFNRLRLNLVSELGIEPGASVQQLQYRILNSADLGRTVPRRPVRPARP